MNNSNNIFQQKRILLAVVISFLFFVVYDYFFIPKQQIKLEQNITTTQADSQNATNINAPQQNPQANLNVAATSNTIPQDKIIADINGQLLRQVKIRIIDAICFCVSEWIGFHYVIP